MTERLGWAGHHLPPNSRTLQYGGSPHTTRATCPWLLGMRCWGLAMRVEGRGAPCNQRYPDIQPLPLTLTEQPSALRPWVGH